ncbi:2Fe-2S iron-sulfur cluster-binding protein [Streptomyces sp. CA-251251]|uniref:(2Fe-2S)-binding protein n=1 Tax=Streptomyces sp. CA-251251 TaxID=3240063 RepID=UPI003D8FCB03
MTDDQHDDRHGQGTPPSGGRWDPLPHGDYDDGATAFVKLPEGGVDALLASADSPLAAPGHGYVPPQITVAPATTAGTDPAATGTWAMPSAPVDGSQWGHPDPGTQQGGARHGGQGHGDQGHPGQPEHAGHAEYAAPYPQQDPYGQAARYDAHAGQGDRFAHRPGATGQWDFSEAAADGGAAPAPGQDVTGQWSIPVADGELPDESGEFTTSSLAEQWGGAAPATLPGGAPAPWAPQPAGQPWDDRAALGAPAAGEEPPPEDAAATADPAPYPVQAPDEAPADGRRGPVEAAEGPAEAPEGTSEGADAESSPEAAEEPVTGPPSEAAPEEAGEHEPEQEPDVRPEPVETSRTDAPGDPAGSEEPPPAGPQEEHPLASYVLRVNGADRPVTDAWIGESLLYVLRERLGLAGAKDGCSQGECGACNVQVDGRLVASCLVPSVTAAGSEVRTVEGLAADGQPSDVQRALARRGAVQCGFCVPGMAMTVHNLLEGNPAPTELEARQALCGNLCRCSGYRGVLEAVKEVVAEREAHSAVEAVAEETTAADADEPRIPHQAGPGAGGVNPSAFESQGPPGTPDTHPHEPHDGPYGRDDRTYGRDDRTYGQDDRTYGRDDRTYGQDGGHA